MSSLFAEAAIISSFKTEETIAITAAIDKGVTSAVISTETVTLDKVTRTSTVSKYHCREI
jgi:hypothetical protein